MAYGIMQNDGSNITGFSSAVQPDKQLTRSNTPRVHLAVFGDGYEQRLRDGINNVERTFSISFKNQPKAIADDIAGYFNSLAGVDNFTFTIPDTNGGSNEEAVKVVCDTWSKTYTYDEFYNVTATLREVFES